MTQEFMTQHFIGYYGTHSDAAMWIDLIRQTGGSVTCVEDSEDSDDYTYVHYVGDDLLVRMACLHHDGYSNLYFG